MTTFATEKQHSRSVLPFDICFQYYSGLVPKCDFIY